MAAYPDPDRTCLFFLHSYLQFFDDNHLSIRDYRPSVNETSWAEVAAFRQSPTYVNRERIYLDSARLYQRLVESTDPNEGIYEDSVFRVAILRDSIPQRHYFGVVLRSKTPLWAPNQVLLEILAWNSDYFAAVKFARNHAQQAYDLSTSDASLSVVMPGVKKVSPVPQAAQTDLAKAGETALTTWFGFKPLNDSTYYLRLGSFEAALGAKFDPAYAAVLPLIREKPYLIVDLRDNRGGSDLLWQPVAELLYTQPYEIDQVYAYCTPDIVRRYEEWVAEATKNPATDRGTLLAVQEHLAKIRRVPNQSSIPLLPTDPAQRVYRQDWVAPYPRKVVLITNRQTASAAEGLVLAARHSQKVLTFGENTGGYLAYGNVVTVKTPGGFALQMPTTKIPARVPYERVGIPPQVRAQPGEGWLAQAARLVAGK
jgi:hypothetical protein